MIKYISAKRISSYAKSYLKFECYTEEKRVARKNKYINKRKKSLPYSKTETENLFF